MKRAAGNPGKRKLNDAEPVPPPADAPKPPAFLGRIGAAEFRRLAPQLATLGILTALDQIALANYCKAFELMHLCLDALKNGTTTVVETRNGSFLQGVPEFAQVNQLWNQMRAWGAELGLSPSSRSGLKVAVEKPKDKLSDFAKSR